MLERGWVGEVLFVSNIDSPTRERAINGECELEIRGCDAVRCVRSIRGGFIRNKKSCCRRRRAVT